MYNHEAEILRKGAIVIMALADKFENEEAKTAAQRLATEISMIGMKFEAVLHICDLSEEEDK